MNETLREDILLCYICQSSAEDDPVSMTCKSQHVFCFSCIYDYYSNCQNENVLSCPNCRFGNGSFLIMSRLKRACDVMLKDEPKEEEEENEREIASSKQFFLALPDLKRRFPRKFRHSMESCVVTTQQMMLFVKNHELLNRLRNRNNDHVFQWRDSNGNLIPTRSQRQRSRTSRTLPRFSVPTNPSVRVLNLHSMHDLLSQEISSESDLSDEDYIPSSEERENNSTEEQEEEHLETLEGDEDENTSALNATLDLIRSINAHQRRSRRIQERQQQQQQTQEIETPPSPMPYLLRSHYSNERITRQWASDPETSFCYLVMTLPRRANNDSSPTFRISWSKSSALTFVLNRLGLIRYAAIFVVLTGNQEINGISERAVPILYTVTSSSTGLITLEPTPDGQNIVEFLLNEFNTETTIRLSVHTMISEIREANRLGELSDLISREITTSVLF